jgi:hypothetical protein
MNWSYFRSDMVYRDISNMCVPFFVHFIILGWATHNKCHLLADILKIKDGRHQLSPGEGRE